MYLFFHTFGRINANMGVCPYLDKQGAKNGHFLYWPFNEFFVFNWYIRLYQTGIFLGLPPGNNNNEYDEFSHN
jgi:hypothetical protein